MKNRLGKRIISILLSALMVISMIPTFALTAFAVGSSGTMAEFLTSKETLNTGITNNGVTWDDEKGGAYFDGSDSVKLNSRPLKGVTQSSGFVVSMDVYNTDNRLSNKYLSFKNGNQFYEIDGSSPDWWTVYRTQISNGTNTRGYYTSDLNSTDFTSVTASANGNDSYPVNEWYTFTVSMNTDGSYSYYRNGDLLGTFVSNYISTGNGGGLTDESAASVISGLTDYFIGASDVNGTNGFTGYIKNVKICDSVKALDVILAMSKYEHKINGTIYKNMAPAYQAYVNAAKALDSFYYGGTHNTVTDANLSSLASTLNTATNNMTVWTQQGARVTQTHGVFGNDSNNGDYGYALHNMLYVQTGLTVGGTYCQAYVENGDYPVKKELYYPQATLLYVDENSDPTLPIMLRVYNEGKTGWFDSEKTRYAISAIQNSETDKWSLTKKNGSAIKWFGQGSNLDYSWSINDVGKAYLNSTNSGSVNYDSNHTFRTRYKKNNYSGIYSNYLTYIGTMNDSVAYDTITPDFHVYCNSGNGWNATDGLSGDVKGGVGNSNGFDGAIHVINYGRLVRKINSYASSAYGADISQYKQNRLNANGKSVSDFFTKLDALTNFDLHSYFTSSNDWNGCQSAMTSVINDMNNQSMTADDNSHYAVLRNALEYEGIITKLGDNVSHSVYEMATVADGAETYSNYAAFADAYDAATSHMAALNGGSYVTTNVPSTLATALIDAFNNLGIKGAEEPSISGDGGFIGSDDTVTITNNDTNGATVYYTVAYDGEETPSVSGSFKSASETISVFDGSTEYGTAVVSAWSVLDASTSSTVTKSYINEDYESEALVYRESFDDASVLGSNFNTGSEKGTDGSIANEGTVSVEASAGAAYDKRVNVLKINSAAAASRGNYVQLENPLSKSVNAAYAKRNGITVSFWRHMNADCAAWLNAVNFTSYDASHTENRYKYATLTASGRLTFVQRENNSGDAENGGWMDYFPYDNDITNHSASSNTGFWTNIVLTVDPNKSTVAEAFTIYINGEPHDVRSTDLAEIVRSKGGDYSSMSDSEVIDAFFEFITDKSTHLDFGYGGYNESDKSLDMWLDDIRIYTEPLTQVDINNMYTDALNDAKAAGVDYQSSTSHDPTNVTVYTLKSAVQTDNGTKAAGSQVGQEFIDYYNVPASNYDVEYYSFGTGLTVYHSYDNLNWTVVGDSEGRCGYQNQGLFVSANGEEQPYYTTLAEPLEWAALGTSRNGNDTREGAAGKLVWAPHIMYNLSQDKWMYYGSTSAWQSSYSAVFLLTSDYVDHGYKYQQMIVKTHGNDHEEGSSDSTNAIDSCVYYGHNADGSINKNQLYCLFGSWGDIMVKSINADGTRSDAETDFGTLLSVSRGGGEGGYMTYRADSSSSTGGYYYYFISPGANGWAQDGGAYHVRTYRSEYPTSGFVSIANTAALDQTDPHGNAMITGYENAASTYQYKSIGHSSVYTAYNSYGEAVYVNAAHTREFSKDSKPTEDGQLATRQIWLIGNVAIHNPVAFTSNGWPTAFPKLYDNTFSLHNKGESSSERNYFTAYDIDGVYSSNTMTTDGSVAPDEIYKIFAINSTTGVIVDDKTVSNHPFVLEHTDDATYMHIKNNDGSDFAEGVIANQGTNGEAVPMFSFIPSSGSGAAYHVWGVKTDDNPTTEEIVEALEKPMSDYTSISGEAYYKGVVATNGYSNAIYSTTTTAEGNQLDKFYQYMHMLLPTETVLVYDGITTPSAPAVFSNLANGNRNQVIKYVACTTNGLDFTKNWQGTVTDASAWPGSRESTDSFGYDADHITNSGTQNDTSSTRYWWNNLYYTGSGNTTTYYDKFTNPTFHVSGAYGSTNQEDNIPSPASTIYVINYKPIIDILNGTTKLTGTNLSYLDVIDDVAAGKYTPSSTMQFFRAMELVIAVNPTNAEYNYSSGAESAVQSFVEDMQQAIGVFNIVELHKRADLTKLENAYNKADSLLLSLDGKIAQYDASSVNALVNATTATNVSKYLNADAETKAEYSDSVQTDADSLADDILAAYDGLKVAANDVSAETVDAYETAVATISKLDPDAYNQTQSITTAISTTNTIVGDSTVEYGDATINVIAMSASDQDVQDATTVILSALTTSVKTYTIKTYGVDEVSFNNGTFSGDGGTYTATYGTTVTCVGDPSSAWYLGVKTNTTEKKLAYYGYGRRLQVKVMGNMEIKAVQPTDSNYQIKIVRDYDNTDTAPVQYVDYVSSGYEFELPSAPAFAYYTFAGYDIGGTNYNAGDKITVNADTEIIAKYNYNNDVQFAINTNKGNESAAYNGKVSFEGDEDTYAWVEQVGDNSYRPFYIGKDLSFFATESTSLTAVDEETFNNYNFTLPVVNLRQSGAMVSGTRTIFNAQLVDGGREIKEYGILVGVGNFTDEDLTIENSGKHEEYTVVRAKSTRLVGANQFSIAINNLPDGYKYRGYVIYENGDNEFVTNYTDIM